MLHTGFISFCDRVNNNIKSSDAKDVILEELQSKFHVSVLQRHWHLFDQRAAEQINRSPHLACLRSNGNPYFMFFTRFEDIEVIYYIDKKIQPGYQKPRIILARGMFDPCVFDGTLLDGEMVKTASGSWIFLINDITAFRGEYLTTQQLPARLELVYTLLSQFYTPDPDMDVCRFQVKKYAYSTREGVAWLYEFAKTLDYTCRGVYFWPFSSKYKPKLHNFDMSVIVPVVRKVKDTPDFRESAIEPVPQQASQQQSVATHVPEGLHKVMWLRKTEYPDVYDVYTTDQGQVNNTKVGIAHVSSMATSKMLRSVFKDTTVAMYFPMYCEYKSDTNKWLPLKLAAV